MWPLEPLSSGAHAPSPQLPAPPHPQGPSASVRTASLGTVPPAQEWAGGAVAMEEEGGTMEGNPLPYDLVVAKSSPRLLCPTR